VSESTICLTRIKRCHSATLRVGLALARYDHRQVSRATCRPCCRIMQSPMWRIHARGRQRKRAASPRAAHRDHIRVVLI